jgi:hypothetical protein
MNWTLGSKPNGNLLEHSLQVPMMRMGGALTSITVKARIHGGEILPDQPTIV